MLSIILNICGLFLIVFSIYMINKDLKRENTTIEELISIEGRIKDYYGLIENTIEDFGEFIDLTLNKINNIDNKVNKKSESSYIEEFGDNTNNENDNSLYIKIIELKRIGLTKEEIAKKLNKGVREVDIILKMYSNNKKIDNNIKNID
ncbi:hypothetical protein KQI42_06650 [Tissierella sp. MSJ-40]|uniref:DUF2802 domain-containing protein n=1 Tax=Tissierella simiarum TaxID=2841534 RepID=A0ABS6E627_9FIRM|nr:hypothetical protein [Tissierella simiarum]MBU5437678.1 hypothetical protein [Tissierella simiarum]